MENKKVTFTQMMFSIVLFNFGSSVVMGVSSGLVQDGWISILLGAAFSVPLFCVYARIFKLFPEKDLFQILKTVFGRIGGKVITVMLIWYLIHLSALILEDFATFTQTAALPDTPQLVIRILMILTSVYLVRGSMRAIGKWSLSTVFIIIAVVILTFFAAIPHLKLDALLPVFEHSSAEISKSTFEVFSFPYAESVAFLCVAGYFNKKDSPYKLFMYSLAIILVVFLVVFIRNITLLGPALSSLNYFPSYMTGRIIEIGDFLARIEGFISSNFMLAGIAKIAICLLGASKGIASLFDLEDYRPVILPTGLLTLAISSILYKNLMEVFSFLDYYPYYAFPVQVIIPMAVWIAGEMYVKRNNCISDIVKMYNYAPD